jgi:hypothetical protein
MIGGRKWLREGRTPESLFDPLPRKDAVKAFRLCLLTFVLGYSAALMSMEYRFGQDHVRPYFSDINGPVRFFAVNTTLSSFLLWTVGLAFGTCWLLSEKEDGKKPALFYLSQSLLFFYLGVDELYRLHEWAGGQLGIKDAYVLLVPGGMIAASLWFWGDLDKRSWRTKGYLLMAGVFFAVMVSMDTVASARMVFRLSVEDLSKLWSDVFLLLFAGEIFGQHIAQMRARIAAGGRVEAEPTFR